MEGQSGVDSALAAVASVGSLWPRTDDGIVWYRPREQIRGCALRLALPSLLTTEHPERARLRCWIKFKFPNTALIQVPNNRPVAY
jgi:hypothetical protein